MSDKKFTDAPWPIRHDKDDEEIVIVKQSSGQYLEMPDEKVVCTIVSEKGDEESIANAHLISAAPELYKAAESALLLLKVLGLQSLDEYQELASATSNARGEK